MSIAGTNHLTVANPALAAREAATVPGMANWAGGGPPGKSCAGCAGSCDRSGYGELGRRWPARQILRWLRGVSQGEKSRRPRQGGAARRALSQVYPRQSRAAWRGIDTVDSAENGSMPALRGAPIMSASIGTQIDALRTLARRLSAKSLMRAVAMRESEAQHFIDMIRDAADTLDRAWDEGRVR